MPWGFHHGLLESSMIVRALVRRVVPMVACLALAAPAAAQYVRVTTALGGAQPNGVNGVGVISADGRFAAFESAASNLVAGDTNNSTDIFVRDLVTLTTTRVSVAQDGSQRDGDSGTDFDASTDGTGELDISDDGRYVVFVSRAPLAPGDAAICISGGVNANCPDIYVRDRIGGTTTRATTALGGGEPNGASHNPQMSGDGRWIVYESEASNLVGGDTNEVTDVFLFDRQVGTTVRISVASGGGQADLPSLAPSVSDDGSVIAFVSASTMLSAETDTLTCERAPPACQRPFVVDRTAGTTRRLPAPAIVTSQLVTLPAGPTTVTFRVDADRVFVAPDGSSVAVNARSIASSLALPSGSENWIYDRPLGRVTTHVPGTVFGSWNGRRFTYRRLIMTPAISGSIGVVDIVNGLDDPSSLITGASGAIVGNASANGRYAIFQTNEAKVPEDTDGLVDIYMVDRDADGDGMPSTWETLFGLNPGSVADAATDLDGDGATNLAEFQRGSHPKGFHTRYLAEGAANSFFRTEVSIANPGTSPTTVVTRFLGDNARTWAGLVPIPARQERVVSTDGRFAAAFSTVVESDQPTIADRTMTWGGGYGSHSETASAAPATTWFLAEGATHGAFQLFYLLQNPGSTAAHVDITYLRPTPAAPLTLSYTIAAEARLTIPVDAIASLEATDVSARIVSDAPILVERAMYMNTVGPALVFGAGHAGSGVTATNTRWFLAEGATGNFFDMYYLIANPAPQPTRVRITYLLQNGTPFEKEYQVAGQSRRTIGVDVEDARLADALVSAIVESLDGVGIVVERSMWWPGQGRWQEGHLSAGSTVTSRRWAIAGGISGPGTETFVLIANTSNVAGTATLTVLRSHDGPVTTAPVALPPNSRVSVPASHVAGLLEGGSTIFGMLIESDGPDIVVERATYLDFGGMVWAAGHASLGTPLP
jgi:Tol biopolymer transport system component